jgi:hypothetical protein
MSITLYPNQTTTRQIIQAVAAGNKRILWINGPRTLYYNPAITIGYKVGVNPTPDSASGFDPDYVVMQGTNGFAAAAQAAGLFTWNNLSDDVQDALAGDTVWRGVTVQRGPVVTG